MEREPADGRKIARRKLAALLLMGGGVTALVAAVVLIITLGGVFGGNGYDGPGELTDQFGTLEDTDHQFDRFATSVPDPSPTPPPSDAPIASLSIPRFNVEGSVITLGLDENRVMEAPDGPWDIAWYDFTAYPGTGSNSVFSGHVDWYNVGPGGGPGGAIFWNLKDLQQGDIIRIELADGTVYEYSVKTKRQVDPTNDFSPIVGPTATEMVTLITCGGSFDTTVQNHYNARVVVQAERVAGSQSAEGASTAP